MPDLVDRLGAALLDASLAATAISGLVVLAMIQCRQPARRRGWARAGLLSTLALLPLAALNPVPRIDLRGPLRAIMPTNLDAPASPVRTPGGRRDPCTPPIPLAGPDRSRDIEGACTPEAGAYHPHGPSWVRQVARVLVVSYGVGASIALGWIALGLWGSAWVVRRAWPPSEESLVHHRSLPFEGGSSRPRLLVSDRTTRPVLVGCLRPVVLVPPEFDDPKSPDRLRLSLLHELAHAESLDHRFAPAATLAQAIWFFLPPVWWIRDQMKLDQEFLADRRAVAHFGTSGRYASSLVELAASAEPGPVENSSSSSPRIPRPSSTGQGVASSLIQRVVMLLKCPFAIEGQTPLWWRWSTAVTLALTTLAASCLTLRGLAGWSMSATSPTAEVSRSFRVSQLTIRQRERDEQPFDLRFRLPDRFTLTFEVMTEPGDILDVEVLNHRLGPTAKLDSTREVYRLWHQIRIRRAGGADVVEVDGSLLAPDPKPTRLAPWLTLRPSPGQTARIRDLELSW